MEIAVLVKQVPDTEAALQVAPDGAAVVEEEGLKWILNPYDEFAVEEALRLREVHGGSVTVFTAGPDRAVDALRSALAMGADKAVFVGGPEAAGADPLGTARILAAALKRQEWDLVLCGMRAVDGDSHQVGPAVAEFLGIPQITSAVQVEVADGHLTCHRAVDGGTLVVRAPLPALVTAQKGLNEPRFTSMMGIMKAKKKPLETLVAADLGLSPDEVGPQAARVRVRALRPPPERKPGRVIEGETAEELARELFRSLVEEARVL